MTRIATWLLAVSIGLTLAVAVRRVDLTLLDRANAVLASVVER